MRSYVRSGALICLVGLWGCSNPCEEALTHVHECLQLDPPDLEEEPECDDAAECEAECALDASCEAFVDASSAAAGIYRACVDGC